MGLWTGLGWPRIKWDMYLALGGGCIHHSQVCHLIFIFVIGILLRKQTSEEEVA